MDIAAFDLWRTTYDGLDFPETQAFYDLVVADHPCQKAYDVGQWRRFFGHVTERSTSLVVLEVGGWKGELAEIILAEFPQIAAWHNLEISKRLRGQQACMTLRYHFDVPGDFVWRVELPAADVFVASHTIEHIRAADLARLLGNLPNSIGHIAFNAPLVPDASGYDWTGYHGSHILEIGWRQVGCLVQNLGFDLIPELNTMEFRAWSKSLL